MLTTIIIITNTTMYNIFITRLPLCLVCLSAWLILQVSDTLHCIENYFSGIFKFQRIRRRRDEIFIVSPAPLDRMRCAKFLGEIATFFFSPCQLLPWIVLTIVTFSFSPCQLLPWIMLTIVTLSFSPFQLIPWIMLTIVTFSFSPCQLLPWIVLTISHSHLVNFFHE